MTTLELPWAAFDAPTTWYRLPSVKVAFVVSLLLHAAAIVLLPNLRVPEPQSTPPLVVELVPQPPPPPLVKPEVPPPPPVVKAIPRPVQPAPVPEVKPEPKPEPPPVAETRTPPPPQPIAVPPRPVQPEPQAATPVRVEPPAPVQPPAPPQPPALDVSALRDYSAIVSGAVAKKKVYPRMALTRRWQGTTDLKLQIAADGNLKALSVTHSSGFEVLDDQAMKMVKEAMPLPVLPEALRGRELVIDIPVAFKLQD
jgi:protein TonB